jgi:hypothetical protein
LFGHLLEEIEAVLEPSILQFNLGDRGKRQAEWLYLLNEFRHRKAIDYALF